MDRSIRLILFSLVFSFTQFVHAAEPADSVIKNAMIDIARFEQQAAGLTASRNANIRRILKLMNLSYQRLGSSANQDHASWQETNQRYLDLQNQLTGLLDPANKAATQAATQSATQSGATTASATGNESSSRSNASSGQTDVQPLVSGQRVQVKKLLRDMNNVRESIVTTGPSTLQSPSELAARKKRFEQFTAAVKRYPQVDDPDVQAARKAYLALRNTLTSEFERAKQQLAELGNVQERLTTLRANFRQYPVPEAMRPPFSESQATDWVKAAGNARTVAEHNYKELQQMAPIAYLPETVGTPDSGAAFDASDLGNMQAHARSVITTIESRFKGMQDALAGQMNSIREVLGTQWQEPGDGKKSWLYTADGREKEAFDYFDQSEAMASSSLHLERAVGREPQQALDLLPMIEQSREDFLAKKALAISSARMPEPASDDKQMLEYARVVLDNPDYEFGEYGPIVLTTPEIVERERKDSEIDIDDVDVSASGDVKMSGTETTWTYKWQEFKFATVLKEQDGTLNIWWITARNYSSGGNSTPLNRWVSGKSHKGNPILAENIGK